MKICPSCKSKTGIREIFYGLPDGPVDENKYAIGGCCISDNDPSAKCIDCDWKGEYVDNLNGWKRGTKFVELADISKMNDAEIDDYAKKTWSLLTGEKIEEKGK